MSSRVSNFPSDVGAKDAVRRSAAFWLVLSLHALAVVLMAATEVDPLGMVVFLIVWAMLNCLWLVPVRRPSIAALLSFELVSVLSLISRFKYDKLWMTIDFLDVLIVDRDTSAFLLATFPTLRWFILAFAVVTSAAIIVAWRLDHYRVRPQASLAGFSISAVVLAAISLSCPTDLREDFVGGSYVSKFARTGVEAIQELRSRGYLEVAEESGEGRTDVESFVCHPPRGLPHIILLHDESSFDITLAPGIAVPSGYHDHFRSFDGRERKLRVEGVGGPSWFTEYNVLTGLSVRSFGRFATAVTRIAAGRVHRGLPRLLDQCGYRTVSLYPFYGSFLGSRAFQTTTGISRYLDMRDLDTRDFEADSFYLDKAIDVIEGERGNGPLFLYVYTVANHFPWDKRLRPELTPNWHDLGNAPDVDEYIRRQGMTAKDYREFVGRLARKFPTESFLIIRYGDHQPQFGAGLIDRSLGPDELAKRVEAFDPRYLTTYYAIDAVNFVPIDVSSALDGLDAPYLPIVIAAAAGVALDPSFSEQSAMLRRCGGVFYGCEQGMAARKLNRFLMEAGLIEGL
jgi:Sulfatase